MRARTLSLLILLAAIACSDGGTGTGPGSDGVAHAAAATITAAEVRAHVAYLASDELRGRATPSPGLEAAAAYIAAEFQRLGLDAAGDGDTFFQRFPPLRLQIGALADPGAAPAVSSTPAFTALDDDPNPPNVAAILPGSDSTLRDSYVVFSAHFDHLGVGIPDTTGDSIYNGADDNASGTAAVLEIAEAFASLPEAPARSVIFLTVSGEEEGLVGSEYFAAHPPVPLGAIVADINLDMVGRNDPDSVFAIGLDYSSLGPLALDAATRHPDLHLTVAPDLWPSEHLFYRSDQYSFARRGVPAIFFTTGLHADYHRPSDEVDRLDAGKNARVARLAFYLGLAVADSPTPPEWGSGAWGQYEDRIGPLH